MNELERIIALANHGIIRTPEARNTTKTTRNQLLRKAHMLSTLHQKCLLDAAMKLYK